MNSKHSVALQQIKRKAQSMLSNATGSHDWEHTQRVVQLCQHIGPIEGVDMDVLLAAAYLHDIGRRFQDGSNGKVCHAHKGAELAEPIIAKTSFTQEQQQNVLHCIAAHRFRNNTDPQTMEAKVLFDADKLDAIGAVGVARAYLFAGEVGACLHNPDINIEDTEPYSRNDTGYREYKVKLCKIRDRVLTDVGRRMANERHAFMEHFFERFLYEYEGKG